MPINVIAYRGDRAACWYYRLHCPFGHLAMQHQDEYHVTISGRLDTTQIGKYDVVILQRQYKPDVFGPVVKMKEAGSKLIYEVDDDLFHIPEWNTAHTTLSAAGVQRGIRAFLELVDAVFVTTEALAAVYRKYCKKVYVLPNSLDLDFFTPSPRNSAKPVVCWQGSLTHSNDLKIMQDCFYKLGKNKDIMLKMWCGFDKNNKPIFDIPGAYTIPLVTFESFYQMFSQMDGDVGLAPLTTVPFNRSKSNLKFLEYTMQGMVTVASDFGPYKDTIINNETGILISDNRDWYAAVMSVIEDKAYKNTLLKNAQAFVKEHFDMRKNYKLWKTAIDEIVGGV